MHRLKLQKTRFQLTRSISLSKARGQSLIETLAGFMIIIPLALFAFDVSVMVVASQKNEHLAQDAARAAANQLTSMLALEAAKSAIKDVPTSSFITTVSIQNLVYDEALGQVTVSTEMDVKLPISLSFMGKTTFHADASQPIVATPAPI